MIQYIILTLAIVAGLTLLGMTVMMCVEAFGLAMTAGYGLIMVLTAVGLYAAPSPTILILGLLALACILGLAVPLIIGAVIGKRTLITSWPTPQEQSFQSFEMRAASAHGTAMVCGLIAAAVMFVFALGIKFGIDPPKSKIGETMNMENLSK